MPTEELKFEELLKEYVDVIESTDVAKLEEENKIIKVDIERKGKEEKNINIRIEEIKAELESLDESSIAEVEDKESKLEEAEDFKEKKQNEIKKLERKVRRNDSQIRKANNIGTDVIKRAEEKTNKENEEIKRKIAELEERKAKYGIKRIDKDGNENIQLTKEEQIVVDTIDKDIKNLEKEIRDNKKAFLLFKKTIEETKKDKEAFLALKNKVKEEPKKEKLEEKPEQKKEEKRKEEPKNENNNRKQGEILTGVNGAKVHFGDGTKTAENTNPTVAEPKKETESRTVNPTLTREGKGEAKGRVIPGVPQPEHEIHEVKDDILVNPAVDPTKGQDIYSNTYNQALAEYKMSLEMYDQDLETLYDLQQKYENGEIEYSEYEKHAEYMVGRYRFIKEEYNKTKEQYDFEKSKQDKFIDKSNEDLENKLKELDEETTELWQQGVHENTPDAKRYHEALEEIKKIKEELKQRKENPLRGMSLEELEAKKHELYAKIAEQQEPDEYEFRTHKENGLEGYEEDEIDKGLREIRQEIERRQPKLEAPEKPEQPMMIKEKDNGKVPPQNESNLPAKSGLQVFREQFNQMPDIKDRHTLSERLKLLAPLGITVGALSLSNPLIGVPVIGASMLAKPIAYRLTGQKKLEKQIEEQFLDLAKESPEEFEKMVDYLSEERIEDLTPNAVILNALHRTMLKVTKKESEKLNNENIALENERKELLKASEERGLTKEELERLGQINRRIIDIRDNEAPKVERRLKDIKRGKDRVSAKYKGNIKTRFNIFAHRNSTTEEYKDPLNKYADAEYDRDFATVNGDQKTAANKDIEMQGVMDKYTHQNKFKIHNSQFNGRQGVVRVTSDVKDNTVQNLSGAIILGYGITKTVQQVNEYANAQSANKAAFEQQRDAMGKLKQEVDGLDKGTMQGVADGNVTDAYAQAEHTIVHENGVTTSQAYRQGDIWAQQAGGNVGAKSQLQGNDKVGWFDSLIETVKSRKGIAKRYGDASDHLTLSQNAPDHTAQIDFTSKAADQIDAELTFLGKMRNIVDIIGKNGNAPQFQEVKKSFLGPIATTIAYVMRGKSERDENKAENKHNKAVELEEK